MIDIRRFLNETYLYNRLERKDIFYLSLIVILIIFFKFSSIVWWSIIGLAIWVLSKFYSIKRKHIDEEEMDDFCAKNPKFPKCLIYNKSKKNYKEVVDKIKDSVV